MRQISSAIAIVILLVVSTAAHAQSGPTGAIRERLRKAAEAQQQVDEDAARREANLLPHPSTYDGTKRLNLSMKDLQAYSRGISILKGRPNRIEREYRDWDSRCFQIKHQQETIAAAFQRGTLKSTDLLDRRNVVLDDHEDFYGYVDGIEYGLEEKLREIEARILRNGMTARDTSYVYHIDRLTVDHSALLEELNRHVDEFYAAAIHEGMPLDFYPGGAITEDLYGNGPSYPTDGLEVGLKSCWLQLPPEYAATQRCSEPYELYLTACYLYDILWSEDYQKLTAERMLKAFAGRLRCLEEIEENYKFEYGKNLRSDIQSRARCEEGRAIAKLIWCN